MSAREKLVEVLDAKRKWPDAPETADAILAAMPEIVGAMVKPLVWMRRSHKKHDGCVEYAETTTGTYFICYDHDDFTGYYCDFVFLGNCTWYGSGGANSREIISRIHDDDLSDIKAAAEAHHRAQVLSAMDIK